MNVVCRECSKGEYAGKQSELVASVCGEGGIVAVARGGEEIYLYQGCGRA